MDSDTRPDPLSSDATPRLAALEAEVSRLQRIEAAAREVKAFLEGRRPTFPHSYPLDVLRSVFPANEAERPLPMVRVRPVVRRPRR